MTVTVNHRLRRCQGSNRTTREVQAAISQHSPAPWLHASHDRVLTPRESDVSIEYTLIDIQLKPEPLAAFTTVHPCIHIGKAYSLFFRTIG